MRRRGGGRKGGVDNNDALGDDGDDDERGEGEGEGGAKDEQGGAGDAPKSLEDFSNDAEKLSAILKLGDVEMHKHMLSAD